MIKFILKRETNNEVTNYHNLDYETLLLDVPELEALLTRGGWSEKSFDVTSLIGAEVIKDA